MTTFTRRLYTSVLIKHVDAGHTHIAIFTGNNYSAEGTRGKSGDLVIETITAAEFIQRLQPVAVNLSENVDKPDWLANITLAGDS